MSGSKVKPHLALMQQELLSKQSRIVPLLMQLASRLQTSLAPEDYQIFAKDLERFELWDIEAGLQAEGFRKHEPFETAFPTIVTLIEAIQRAAKVRLASDKHFTRCDECDCGCLDSTGYRRCESEDGRVWMERVECWNTWLQHRGGSQAVDG